MPPITKKSPRPRFRGIIRGYCHNVGCSVRDVLFLVKDDALPDAPAGCPRCQRPLTLFPLGGDWDFWRSRWASAGDLRRQQG